MKKNKLLKSFIYTLCVLAYTMAYLSLTTVEVNATDFPQVNLYFDPGEETVVVEGIPAGSADGNVEYSLNGYLNYGDERVETFCYAPNVRPYDVPDSMAYIFNWADLEFLLPCSGEYTFTVYVMARYIDAQGTLIEEKGPKTSIAITLHKKDESTNWGPGLPNTTVEPYSLEQIKGQNKNIIIEESEYNWTINGNDLENVPEANLSLKVTENPPSFNNVGVDDFFGESLVLKLNIEHNGEFGFKATLDYNIGTEYTGKYANLFYVVGDGTFEYLSSDIVDENGLASFIFTHASDYVVAITDVEYSGQALNPKPEESEVEAQQTEESEAEEQNNETSASLSNSTSTNEISTASSNALHIGLIIGLVTLVAVVVVLVAKKRF